MAATDATALRATVSSLMGRARSDLAELVSFRSVADAKIEPPEECEKAAQWVIDAFAEAGLQDVTASATPDGSKAVHGHAPGPPGSPTVLLYCHYDVQPPLGEAAWRSPIWELTERDGRWYGRGAADCKGNIVMHLTALRALQQHGGLPCNVKLICEGSEEQGTGGLEAFVPPNAALLKADTILVVDTGNFAVGVPTLTTTLRGMTSVDVTLTALSSAMHSGMFGGPAPDPVLGLIQLLATLHDGDGNTTIEGLDASGSWSGVDYPPAQFRADANVLDGVELMGDGSVADMLWARPSATVLGIDVPPVIGSSAAIQASAAARVSLRIPPGVNGQSAQDALVAHLRAKTPWGLKCEIARVAVGDPFVGSLDGPAFEAMKVAMEEAFGHAMTTEGQGGSIPLCNVFAETFPDAEIMLLGVEEPKCLIHAPNESVDPREIEHTALAEALFLQRYAASAAAS
ncbi:dipeptidase [Conexibacter sp. JD483]|uniref:dipeptidase n=1 Tax=unclassified Conexibacter TaxID=2627773 RepID=UPI0027278059|nr:MULTISPECIES: dipeptidase [unclassified Conexibacter]MDO8187261.1 dipeptidase [Conexibacter sp. CPCC 205706]MDO8198870.1 dipeptidase [Conexibacter sp. CPCC 205762]MDR9371860.1 dipeptidase [Conexibacter sp. JD483]